MRVLALFDPQTKDLRGVLLPMGNEPSGRVDRFFDPPDHYFETVAQSTLEQKPPAMEWAEFCTQLPDRVPAHAWWEWVTVRATDLPSAFTELAEKSRG